MEFSLLWTYPPFCHFFNMVLQKLLKLSEQTDLDEWSKIRPRLKISECVLREDIKVTRAKKGSQNRSRFTATTCRMGFKFSFQILDTV